jgi:hypothetical protein
MAVPTGLGSKDYILGFDGVESHKISLKPTNSSGSYKENEMVNFGIPAYRFSSINPARTYLKFKIKSKGTDAANAVFSGASQCFQQMILKNDSGVHLESIDQYHTLSRVMDNMKTKAQLESEASLTKDWRVLKHEKNKADLTDYSEGITVIHDLKSGILGKSQKMLVNLDSMRASNGAAFQLELYCARVKDVFSESRGTRDIDYEIYDVSLELELLKIPESLQMDFNARQLKTELVLPYKTYTFNRQDIPNGTACNLQLSNHENDVSAIYSVIQKKSHNIAMIANNAAGHIKSIYGEGDSQRFIGGRFTIVDGKPETSDTIVEEYQMRYANKSFPLSPVVLSDSSALASQNAISTFEVGDKAPYMSDTICGVDGKFVPLFETSTFIVCQNFKSTSDPRLKNGLNLSGLGAPLEVNMKFKTPVTGVHCLSFLEFTQTLYTGKDGNSTLNKP